MTLLKFKGDLNYHLTKEPNFYNDIDEVWRKIIHFMQIAVKSRKHPFHTPCLSYITLDNLPIIRSIVLRHFNFSKKFKLEFHTDIRSKKVLALKTNPHIAMHFYSFQDKIQINMNGTAKIHSYDTKDGNIAWEQTSELSRRCYLIQQTPGDITSFPTSGFPDIYLMNNQKKDETEIGRKNFCLISIDIDYIEWLYLAFTGNRRAYFKLKDNDITEKNWLIP